MKKQGSIALSTLEAKYVSLVRIVLPRGPESADLGSAYRLAPQSLGLLRVSSGVLADILDDIPSEGQQPPTNRLYT